MNWLEHLNKIMRYYFPFLASIILFGFFGIFDVFADSNYHEVLHITKFGLFDAKSNGNPVDKLQVGETYWLEIAYANETGTRQDVGILAHIIDKNKEKDNIIEEFEGRILLLVFILA